MPVLLFWRPGFFYILDDWTALLQMAEHPFGEYLLVPDGEQWFPFFHLVYYGLVRLTGEHYTFLVLVNCLGTGVNAFLVYLFFRRHLDPGLALTLSALYAGAAVHHAIAWNAFYLGYLLSLGFFLGALLLTDAYLRTGGGTRLGGIWLCALLSLLSHNYPLVGLLALPLYVLLVGGDCGRKFWALAATVLGVYVIFALGYVSFAGVRAAASHNVKIFAACRAGLPGAPVLRSLPRPVLLPVLGPLPFSGLDVCGRGRPAGRHPGCHLAPGGASGAALGPVGPPGQRPALSPGIPDPVPAFPGPGLCGPLWHLHPHRGAPALGHGLAAGGGPAALPGLAAPVALGAVGGHGGRANPRPARWTEKYLEMTQAAKTCYYVLSREPAAARLPQEDYQKFCPGAHPVITPDQAWAIRRFLSRPGGSLEF